jgi:hypothetical protein
MPIFNTGLGKEEATRKLRKCNQKGKKKSSGKWYLHQQQKRK